MKVSRFPFGPGRPDDAKPRTPSPASAAASATRSSASRRSPASRTTPPRDALAPELELRLDQGQQLPARRQAVGDPRQDLGQRDEREVGGGHVRPERKGARLEPAGVEALEHGDALVLAKAPVELAVADVEGDHVLGAVLQQAVGEAAGRGAGVEAVPARRPPRPRAASAFSSLIPPREA